MAKNVNNEEVEYHEEGDDVFDDEELNWDDGDDFDFTEGSDNPNKDDRKPIEALKDGVKDGVKQAFTLEEVQKNVEMVLPKEVRHAKDEFNDYISRGRNIMDDAVNSVRGDVNKIRNSIAKAIPYAERTIGNKRILDILKRLGKNEEAERVESERQREENEIAEKLSDFAAFQVENQKQQLASDLLRNETERKRFESQQDLLYAIEDGVRRGTSFHEQLTPKFYFKNLETGYRQLIVQTKIQNTLAEGIKHQKVALDTIVKNTALPDIVKQHKTELFKDLGLRSLYTAATGRLSDYTSTFKDRFLENLGNSVKGFTENIRNSTDMAVSMADMGIQAAEMQSEFGEEKNKAHQAGETAAKYITSFLTRQGMRWGINKFDKNDKIGGLSTYLSRMANGLPELANRYASSESESWVGSWIKSLIPTSRDTEVSHDYSSADHLNKPAQYDGLTRKTIVDIIPQLLSQIHLSTEGIRKSINPDQVLDQGNSLEYDHDTLELRTRSDIDMAFLEKTQSQMNVDLIQRQAMSIVNAIDPWDDVYGFSLDREQRLLLAKEIGLSLGKHKGFNPADMVSEDYRWNLQIPDQDKLAIVNHIRSSFRVGEDVRFDKAIQDRLRKIDANYRGMENTRGYIQQTIGKRSSVNDTELKRTTRLGLGTVTYGRFSTNSSQQYNPMMFQSMDKEYTLDKMKYDYDYENNIDITLEDFQQMAGYKNVPDKYGWEVHLIKNNESIRNPVFEKDKDGKRKEYVTYDEVRDAMARNDKYREMMNRIIRNIRTGQDDTALRAVNWIKNKVTAYHDKAMSTKAGKYIKGEYDDAKDKVKTKVTQATDFVKNTKAFKETERVVTETTKAFSNHELTKALNDILHDEEMTYGNKIKAVGDISVVAGELAKDGIMDVVESEEFQEHTDKIQSALRKVAKVAGEEVNSLYVKNTTEEQRTVISEGLSKATESLENAKEETKQRLSYITGVAKEKLLEQELVNDLTNIATNENLTRVEKAQAMAELTADFGKEIGEVIVDAGKAKVLRATANEISKTFIAELKTRSQNKLNVKGILGVDNSTFSLSQGVRPKTTARQKAVNVLNSFKQQNKDDSDGDPDGVASSAIDEILKRVQNNESVSYILDKANQINEDGSDVLGSVKAKAGQAGKYAKGKASDLLKKLYGAGASLGVDEIVDKASGILDNDEGLFGKAMKQFKEFTQRNVNTDKPIYDIYVKGDQEPKLLASKLRKGHYVLRETQNPVTHVEDINDTVIDITTGEVVITQEDISKGLIDYNGTESIESNASKSNFMRRLDKIQKITGDPFKLLGAIWNNTFAKTMDTTDIYLKSDLSTPIMSRWGMMMGKYYTKDKKPIYKVKDINGPVYDAFGNVLINEHQLADGLVDKKGRPLRGYLIRRGRIVAGALKMGAKAGWAISKPARWLAKKTISSGLSGLGGLLGTMVVDSTVNKARAMGSKGLNIIKDELADIYSIFKPKKKVRTIDGITIDEKTGKERKGNYRDEMKAQDEVTKSRAQEAKDRLEHMRKEREAAQGKGTGIFGLLGKYFPLIIGAFTGLAALFSGASGTLSAIAGGIASILSFLPGLAATRLAKKGIDLASDLLSGGDGPDIDIDTYDKDGKKTRRKGGKPSKGPSKGGGKKGWFKRGLNWVGDKVNLASPKGINAGVKGEMLADKYQKAKAATTRVETKAIQQGLAKGAQKTVTREVAKQAAKAAVKTTTSQAVKLGGAAVLKTVGKRALMFLGPIGAAISAAWLLYDIGSWIYSVATSPDTVDKYRIAAYGINPENEEQAKTILKLEEDMVDGAKVTAEGTIKLPEFKGDNLAKLIHTCLGGQEGLERFNALPPEEQQRWQEGFQEWFNYRFCAVLERNMSVLYSIDPEIKYKDAFGKYIGDLENGLVKPWAERVYYKPDDIENPYGILFDPFSNLVSEDKTYANSMDQEAVKSYLDKVIEEYRTAEVRLRLSDERDAKRAESRGKTHVSKFEFEKKDNGRENARVENRTMTTGLEQANKVRALNVDGTSASLTLYGNNVYIRSDASKIKLDGRSVIDDLIAVRMRLYGLTDLVDTRVKTLLEIESIVMKYIRIDATDTASIDNIDITKLTAVYAPMLSWDISNQEDSSAFRSWFQYRFAPAFLAYISELYRITKSKDFLEAVDKLSLNDKFEIALMLSSLQVPVDTTEIRIWDIDFTPVKGLMVNKNVGTISHNLESLQSGVEEKILTEKDPRGIREVQPNKATDTDKNNAGIPTSTSSMIDLAKNMANNAINNVTDTISSNATSGSGYSSTVAGGSAYPVNIANPAVNNAVNTALNVTSNAVSPNVSKVKIDPNNKTVATQALSSIAQKLAADGVPKEGIANLLGYLYVENQFSKLSEDARYKSPNVANAVFGNILRATNVSAEAFVNMSAQDQYNLVYHDKNRPRTSRLGNTVIGDGWNYRGRGVTSLTGRGNYERYAKITGHDILNNPDLMASDPKVIADVGYAYLKDRIKNNDYSIESISTGMGHDPKKKMAPALVEALKKRIAYAKQFMSDGTVEKFLQGTPAGNNAATQTANNTSTTNNSGGNNTATPTAASSGVATQNTQPATGIASTVANVATNNGAAAPTVQTANYTPSNAGLPVVNASYSTNNPATTAGNNVPPALPPTGNQDSGSSYNWVSIAHNEIGQKEGVGTINPRILEYFSATTLKTNSDKTHWCSAFANWVMQKAGFQGTKSAAAASWKSWSEGVNHGKPCYGALAVYKRGNNGHHVGIVVGRKNGRIALLGGNQSNSVKITGYPDEAIAYMLPKGVTPIFELQEYTGNIPVIKDMAAMARDTASTAETVGDTSVNAGGPGGIPALSNNTGSQSMQSAIDLSMLAPNVRKAFTGEGDGQVQATSQRISGFDDGPNLYRNVKTNAAYIDKTGMGNMYGGTGKQTYHEYDWGTKDPSKKLDWQNVKPTDTNHSVLTQNEVQRSAKPEYGPVVQHTGTENNKDATGLKGLLNQATPELVELGKRHTKRNNSGVDIDSMNSDYMKLLYASIGDFVKQTGSRHVFDIYSANRTIAKQKALYDENIRKKGYDDGYVAKPGRSRHNFGVALDITAGAKGPSKGANADFTTGPLAQWENTVGRKWGFHRPLRNGKVRENWHVENQFFKVDYSGSNPKLKVDGNATAPTQTAADANLTTTGSGEPVPPTNNGAMGQTVNNTPMQSKPTTASDIASVNNNTTNPSLPPVGIDALQPTVQKAFYKQTTDSNTGTANDSVTAAQNNTSNLPSPNSSVPATDNQTKIIEAQQQRYIENHQKMVDSVNSILTEQLVVQKETRDIMSQLVELLSGKKETKPANNQPPKPTMNTGRSQTSTNVPKAALNVGII